MKHIVMYSGGVGSFLTAKRVIDQYGSGDVTLLFTDTLIEDRDLYRFMLETYGVLFERDVGEYLVALEQVPDVSVETMDARKIALVELGGHVRGDHPQMQWIADGRDPWDIFFHKRFLGNSRLAQCSHMLKQDVSSKWVKENCHPSDTSIYLGIDWTEKHRTKRPVESWAPYPVYYPMCDEPFMTKAEMLEVVESVGVAVPKLYLDGFSHNNCGGFCVRAGQGHFANLLKTNPGLYAYHEGREQQMREFLDRDVSILAETVKGIKYPLTLAKLRERYTSKPRSIDMFDTGGCGCFVMDESE